MKLRVRILYCGFVLLLVSCGVDNSVDNSQDEKEQLDSLSQDYRSGDMRKCIERGILFTINHPSNDIGFQITGSAYLSLQENSLAEFYTRKALSLNPNNPSTLTNIAILLDRKENYEDAERYYQKAIKLKPDLAQIYSNYVGNRLAVGDYKVAVLYGEKAVSLAGNIRDKAMLCVAYHKAGMQNKRDSLYAELEKLQYSHLQDLKEIFRN